VKGWLRRLLRRRPRYVSLPAQPAPASRTLPQDRYRPGTVVWGPVRFTDATGEKDRPVVVVGRAAPGVLAVLALSSQAKRDGRSDWYPLGTGDWDRDRRPSWAHLAPYYGMQEKAVRRIGGVLDDRVLAGLNAALALHHSKSPRRG